MNLLRCLFVVLLFTCFKFSAYAQIPVSGTAVEIKGTIKGKVTEQQSGKIVQGVSVMAKTSENLLLGYTFTNDKGEYTLSKLPFGKDFKVFVSLYGYKGDTSEVQKFKFPGPFVVRKDWSLATDATVLKEVEIQGRKPPFVIRNDTLEFDATAFKLLPHAILEDLLNRLPGILIDKDGNITVNGKKATKIQVDGKDFFGGNTGVAMQNLPASIIAKVQVTPTDDPARKFNRMLKPVEDEVTINLLLKKDQNKGILGNIRAGYGTRERYDGNGMLASFGGKLRFGIFGSAGNGNTIGSSNPSAGGGTISGSGGVSGMPLGGTLSATGTGGLAAALRKENSPTPTSGGLSDRKSLFGTFNTEWGKKLKISGNYNFNHQKGTLEKQTDRFNFQETGGLVYRERQSGIDDNNTHSFTTNIELTPDSLSNWRFMPSVTYAPYQRNQHSTALNTKADGTKINSSDIQNQAEGSRKGFGHSLFFGRRSKDGKTGLILNWSTNGEQTGEQLINYSKNEFVNNLQTTIDQRGTSDKNSLNNNLSLQLSRKLSPSFTGLLEYGLSQQSNRLKKYMFNFNHTTARYDNLDSLQSGDNKNNNVQHNIALQLSYNKEHLNISFTGGMRFINQYNRLFIQDTLITIHQDQFTPKLTLNYSFVNNGNLNLSYDIASYAPSADQLSPLNDVSNPLLIVIGNPFLKTATGHNINAGFSKFVPDKEINFHFNGNASFIKNQIIQDVTYDEVGRQIQSYRNVNGYQSLRLSGGVQKGYHIKELSIRPFLNASLNHTQDVGYIDARRNETKQWQYSGNTGIAVSYISLLSFSSSANVSFNQTDYSLNERQDLNYNTQNYSFTAKVSPTGRIEFGSQFSYQYNSQIPENFQRSAVVLNANVSYRFLKNEALNLKLFVNDVFDKAIVNSIIVTPSFRENTSFNALRRYFLFSLQYNFNRLSGKGKTPKR
jgi:hypothetical protein